jgi:hypothetical protein
MDGGPIQPPFEDEGPSPEVSYKTMKAFLAQKFTQALYMGGVCSTSEDGWTFQGVSSLLLSQGRDTAQPQSP